MLAEKTISNSLQDLNHEQNINTTTNLYLKIQNIIILVFGDIKKTLTNNY